MTTVIVPVDFSETSLNAAKYAGGFLKGHYGATLILYNSYAKGEDADAITQQLNDLKQDLYENYHLNIDVLAHEESDFVVGLEKAARHRRADLVIMGITGKSALKQVLFGSNTLKMAETKACPVLIVPEQAIFSGMENVLLTSDFKDTLNTTPSVPIKEVLSVFNPKLHVINVDKDHYISLSEKYEKEKGDLQKLFAEFNPEFYFMRLFDVSDALDLFVKDWNIDLIISVKKNYTFLDRIFKTSHTKKMSFHSNIPILVMHE